MKDAYSFDVSDEEAIFSYNKFLSYLKHLKIGPYIIPMAADTGPIGGNSHMNLLFLLKQEKVKFLQIKNF